MNAFLYLIWTSGRNRVTTALRRVRSPRYAAALIVGGLYIWSFLLRPNSSVSGISSLLGQPTEMIITVLLVVTLMGSWVFGSDTTALAFTQAELSLLFPAPLSRRALIGYKLTRAQIAVVINVLIWVFILRRGGTVLPAGMRALAIWVLFSTLNLHRLGAALVRSAWREHGAAGSRRNRWSIVLFAAIGLSLVVSLIGARAQLGAVHSTGGFFTVLGHVLSMPPASIGLYPFHLIVAPAFAQTTSEWNREIIPAGGMVFVHAVWVFRTDTAFEDAAIEASAERARRLDAMRARRSMGAIAAPRSPASTLRLASVGHPALAIFWKNMLCLRRTAQLRVFVGPVTMAIAIGAATSGAGMDLGAVLAIGALVLMGMLLLFGGRLIRNDLRADMQHLPLIKSLPIPPGEIVVAEVASSALPMAVVQIVLVAFAYVALSASRSSLLGADMRLAILIAAPFAVVALNTAILTIQNATAVLFPAWVRLGPVVSVGVEALGQNMLATVATIFSLALGMIVPMLAAWLIVTATASSETRAIQLAIVIITAAVALGFETYGAMRLLGRALSKAEPLQTA
ncbi:MAG: putative ABC exporter domain-containing protein [Deltaproteobacteria bacterium]